MKKQKVFFLFVHRAMLTSLLFAGSNSVANCQVAGCTDPLAANYNAAATLNNGSCTYNTTSYTPPVKVNPLNEVLAEGSGLQMAGNFLWSFNDGGGAAAIYRIDTITNAILQTVQLEGAVNIDWEDIAYDGINVYIGDFGNNANGARTDLKIYKFPFSAITSQGNAAAITIPKEMIAVISFSYSDQPQPPQATSANHTKFDCEAMIVDDGNIHLFTKNWIDLTTTHYVINGLLPGTYTATPVETIATGFLVTAADKSPGKNLVALLGYKNSGFADHYIYLLTEYSAGKYFNGNKRQINLPNVFEMGQAEGLAFRTSTYGYISNEKFSQLSIPQKLRAFDFSKFVTLQNAIYTFNGNGNWSAVSNWKNNLIPPDVPEAGSEIMIDPQAGGQCLLNVPFTVPQGVKLTVQAEKNFVVQGNLVVQ